MDELATTVRATWDFRYKTSEVLAAARQQVTHHSSRYQWWEKEAKAAEKSLLTSPEVVYKGPAA